MNNNKPFPLSPNELKSIDDAWIFLSFFRHTELTRVEYRYHIINTITHTYTPQQFLLLELILEKLYWNLFTTLENHLKFNLTLHKKHIPPNQLSSQKDKILKRSSGQIPIRESSLRKAYIYKNATIFYKYNYPNDMDLLVYSIMINRSLYETIMASEPTLEYLNNLNIEPYNNNIEFDYPFPNLNTIKPFSYTREERINNIKKMYYDENPLPNWFD